MLYIFRSELNYRRCLCTMYLQFLSVFVLCGFVCGSAAAPLQHRIVDITETSIKISWCPPTKYHFIAVRWYTLKLLGVGRSFSQSVYASEMHMTYVFKELKPFTKYTITIDPTFKDAATRIEPATMEAVTWPAVGQPVKDLDCTLIGTEDIMVVWTAPDEPYGEIEFYQVDATFTDTREGYSSKVSTTGAHLPNLNPMTTYTISICTQNKQANGFGGGLGGCITKKVTTRAPLQHKIVDIAEKSIRISWNLTQNYLLSDILSYTLLIYDGDRVKSHDEVAKQLYMTYEFLALKPFTKYKIYIYSTVKDTAPMIQPGKLEAVTWPSVGQPVNKLHCTHIGSEDIKVAWTAPDKPYGEIEFYQVKVSHRDTQQGYTVKVWTTGAHLLNLNPSTTYTISICTQNKQASGFGGGLGGCIKEIVTTQAQLQHKIATITATTIGISWNPPQNYLLSDIRWYTLVLSESGLIISEKVDASELYMTYVFRDLKPFTKYTISIDSSVKDTATMIEPATMEAVTWPAAGQPAKNLQCTHIGPEDIKVAWTAPEKPYGEIEFYQVEVYDRDTQQGYTVKVSTTGAHLLNLNPLTTYNIFISTQNKQADGYGGGLGGLIMEIVTTQARLQHRVTTITRTRIWISWKLSKKYLLSDIRWYTLVLNESGLIISEKVDASELYMAHVFRGLKSFTKYKISIYSTVKDTAIMIEPATMEAVTWPAFGQPVKNLHCTHIGSEDIKVAWIAPDEPYGEIEFYQVEVTDTDTRQGNTVKVWTTGAHLLNLNPSTTYSISICTQNKQANGYGGGLGECIKEIVTTLDSKKPNDVRAAAVSSQSIQVTWKRPNYTLSDEVGYELEIEGQDFSATFVVGKDVFSHTFSGLQPNREYTINVQVKDRIPGVLHPSGQISRRTWPAVGQKVLDLTLTATDPRSVYATWRPPSEPLGIIEAFEISALNKQTGSVVEYVSKESAITLTGLDASTTYTISVSVRNKKGEDDYSPVVHTMPEKTGGGGGVGEKVSGDVNTLSIEVEIPTEIRAAALSSQSIQVTWKRPNFTLSDEVGYELEIEGKDFSATFVAGKNVFSHTFSGLQPNTEYIFYVKLKDTIPGVLHPSGQISRRTWPAAQKACGGQTFAPAAWLAHQSTKREAIAHSWPWTVGLYTSIRGPYPFCGGTLIAPDWVITAAHCVDMAMNCVVPPVGAPFTYETYANATLFARIGDHDLEKTEKSERDRVVQSIIMHPHFTLQLGSSEHDIALLRLQKAVVADDKINFICLPRQDSAVPLSKECTFASWGAPAVLPSLQYENSPVLMEGRLKLETQDSCQSDAEGPQPEGQTCFGTGDANPCWGDNGAGVNCVDAQGQWILYGIINSGSFLCAGKYATSTKIHSHLDWIKKTIGTKEFA